jgi:ubiquitin carboxyl-terminal hydrolase 34
MTSREHARLIADEPAISVPASPPRRDPIEDADASFTRKRPRLHSGSNSLRAMSPRPKTPENTAAPLTDKQLEMTIRSHPPSSPVHAEDEDQPNANDFLDGAASDADQEPILIASSEDESGSPPIMIIDDDDDDDDDEAVGYTVQMDAADHFRRFPYSNLGSYSKVVCDLGVHIGGRDICWFKLLSEHNADTPQVKTTSMATSLRASHNGLTTSPTPRRTY